MSNSDLRGVLISEDCITFGNLVSSGGSVVGSKETITAHLSAPSPVVERGNARGDLRSVDGVMESADLGSLAAKEVLAILQ